jgi:hypothetical protein
MVIISPTTARLPTDRLPDQTFSHSPTEPSTLMKDQCSRNTNITQLCYRCFGSPRRLFIFTFIEHVESPEAGGERRLRCILRLIQAFLAQQNQPKPSAYESWMNYYTTAQTQQSYPSYSSVPQQYPQQYAQPYQQTYTPALYPAASAPQSFSYSSVVKDLKKPKKGPIAPAGYAAQNRVGQSASSSFQDLLPKPLYLVPQDQQMEDVESPKVEDKKSKSEYPKTLKYLHVTAGSS